MIPKAAIEKAIEGGWKKEVVAHYTDLIVDDESMFVGNPDGEDIISWSIEQIALDPTFWQSLGKALGWGSFYDTEGMGRYHVPMLQGWYPTTTTASGYDEQAWQGAALYFYNLILTNGDIEAFWKKLLPEGTLPANEKEV